MTSPFIEYSLTNDPPIYDVYPDQQSRRIGYIQRDGVPGDENRCWCGWSMDGEIVVYGRTKQDVAEALLRACINSGGVNEDL